MFLNLKLRVWVVSGNLQARGYKLGKITCWAQELYQVDSVPVVEPKTKTLMLVGQGPGELCPNGALGWLLKCKMNKLWLAMSFFNSRRCETDFMLSVLPSCSPVLCPSLPFAGMISLLQAPKALIILLAFPGSNLRLLTHHTHSWNSWRAGGSQASPSPSSPSSRKPCLLPLLKIACVQYLGNEYFSQQSETLKQNFYTQSSACYHFSRKKLKTRNAKWPPGGHHLPRPPWVKSRFVCHSLGPDNHYTVKVLVAYR